MFSRDLRNVAGKALKAGLIEQRQQEHSAVCETHVLTVNFLHGISIAQCAITEAMAGYRVEAAGTIIPLVSPGLEFVASELVAGGKTFAVGVDDMETRAELFEAPPAVRRPRCLPAFQHDRRHQPRPFIHDQP